MTQLLPEMQVPQWLRELSADAITSEPLPLNGLLRDSLYYPACGFDGDPIKYMAGSIRSFVYVDYGYREDKLVAALERPGFKGNRLVASRSVAIRELSAATRPLRGRAVWRHRHPASQGWVKAPFCHWAVFEREQPVGSRASLSRFSLLYVCAEGAAAFEALYSARGIAPKAVAVIQPGTGFGCNWTDFTDPEQALAQAVHRNPGGLPALLLHGGVGRRHSYRRSCWPEYGAHVGWLDKAGGGSIGVWSRRSVGECHVR